MFLGLPYVLAEYRNVEEDTMQQTLVLINPNAASGRAETIWQRMSAHVEAQMGALQVVITQQPDDVARYVDEAQQNGMTHILAVGGDGTNHALINALAIRQAQHPDEPLPIGGTIPVGTGRDWARTLNIPFKPEAIGTWLAQAQVKQVDIGLLHYSTDDGQTCQRYFLNVASSGLGGEVVARVNRTRRRRPWTFLKSTVSTLFAYDPIPMRVEVDGDVWYDGDSYIVAVANGTTFGRGMKVAPHAEIQDGLLDVILVEGMSRFSALKALPSLYNGTHLNHPRVQWRRGKDIKIITSGSLDVELDGEYVKGTALHFSVCPSMLRLLV
ncbi:MAG: diacylglycerol kinase family lipid kinase [Chloroflexi bacterium]|nr:MAG: diacylglycerol kinase family lipid kinase [Chloroflexota bacterium]